MMEWVQTLSYLLTNELRLLLGLFLIARVTNFRPRLKGILFSCCGGAFVTAIQMVSHSTIGPLAVELLVITAVARYYLRDKINLCLFVGFFTKSVWACGIFCCKLGWVSCSIRKGLLMQRP